MGQILDIGNFSKGIITDAIGIKDSALNLIDGLVDRNGEIRSRGQKTLAATLRQPADDIQPASQFNASRFGHGAIFHDSSVDVFAIAGFDGHSAWLVGKNTDPSDHHWIHSGGTRPSIPRGETGSFFGTEQGDLLVHACKGGGANLTEVNHGLMSGSGGFQFFPDGTDETDAVSVSISYAGIYGGFVGPDQSGGQNVSTYELDGTNKITLLTGDPPTEVAYPDPSGLFIAFENAPGTALHSDDVVLTGTTWEPLDFDLYAGFETIVTNVTVPANTPVEGVDYILEESSGAGGVGRIRRLAGSVEIVSGNTVNVKYRSKKDATDVYYRIISSSGDNFYLDRVTPIQTAVVNDVARVISPADPNGVGIERSKYFESHAGRAFAAGSYLNFDTGDGAPVGGSRLRWSGTARDKITVDTSLASVINEHVWYEDAYIDVFDNIGGDITGLHSIGGNLLIVKEGAVGILRGVVKTKSFSPTVSVEVVSTTVGCPDELAHDKSRLGVTFANKEGLWAFDGQSLSNIVDGRIENLWFDMYGSDFGTARITVSSVGNRIFVNKEGSDEYLVYNIDHDYFSRQTTSETFHIFRSGGRDQALHIIESGGSGWEGTHRLIDHAGDNQLTTGTDVQDAAHPLLQFESPHMPLSDTPFFHGRPNTIYISGYSTSDMSVNLIHGRTEEVIESDPALEYKFDAQAFDSTQRIQVGAVRSRPAFRIRAVQDTPGTDTRIYGVGIDIERDTVLGF